MERLFRKVAPKTEWCFNIEATAPLNEHERSVLQLILAEGFIPGTISGQSLISTAGTKNRIVELGPRENFATAWSTNLVAICHACGLTKITRIERSRRHLLAKGVDQAAFATANHDRMTERRYEESINTFAMDIPTEPVFDIPLVEQGSDALLHVPGLSMDKADREFYWDYFVNFEKRNPTNVEIFDLYNANSQHSRHGHFRSEQMIDGIRMSETLMEIVKSTLTAHPEGSILAFCDNSSAIEGYLCWTLMPIFPGKASPLAEEQVFYHIVFTAETHNFPTGIAPFPGAETGSGGRIRDILATGRGAIMIAVTAGYCVADLLIPGYELPWEDASLPYPSNLASSLEVIIRASDGASDYGNKIGEPLILGFARSFDLWIPGWERWGWLKKIMFTGGIGKARAEHIEKGKAEPGMKIVVVGGPGYKIGVGGGAASSKLQGENEAELDFDAVQRGDAEMEQKLARVIEACIAMDLYNPIVSVHDQGAGGPANVLKELVEEAGGRIEIRKINLGDETLSVLVIWIGEYQERCGFLIPQDRIDEFQSICEREEIPCEILGEVTDDGRFVVHDEQDDSTPVDLDLGKVLFMPPRTFSDTHVIPVLKPLELPAELTVEEALFWVLRMLCVASKRQLTTKADRSVGAYVAQQQHVGPLQLPLSNVAVVALSHFGLTGAATSAGEQPIKMLLSPEAGARMAVGEALTNLIWAKICALHRVKCSANWMWAPKLPGEGAALYDAAVAMRDIMVAVGIAVDGGKDSLSMAVIEGDEIIKSPRQLVISTYAAMPDIRKVITPDIKMPGQSQLFFVPFSREARLGGSVLAHVYKQIGSRCPDVDDPYMLKRAFLAVQQLIEEDLILAGHDVSDGGLITTLLEMVFAGNCGFNVAMEGPHSVFARWFAEELGLVLECHPDKADQMHTVLKSFDVKPIAIGETKREKNVNIKYNDDTVLDGDMLKWRDAWEETAHQINLNQKDSDCAKDEKANIYARENIVYRVKFTPEPTPQHILRRKSKPEVAIVRAQGSNGDKGMKSALKLAGFKVWDIAMSDLVSGKINLEQFVGLAAVGGFSFADVPESAKGWASLIRLNPKLKEMFDDFYNRPDTFSLGVCNGCQLFGLLGWVPWMGIPDEKQPRFKRNKSGIFESRWSQVRILESPSIMLKGMADSDLGIWVAHGEGQLYIPDSSMVDQIIAGNLAPIRYIDDKGEITERYPFNPNGSQLGIAALCDPTGRHLAMMPHPERLFMTWQWPYLPEKLRKQLAASPWLQMFQNARIWCEERK